MFIKNVAIKLLRIAVNTTETFGISTQNEHRCILIRSIVRFQKRKNHMAPIRCFPSKGIGEIVRLTATQLLNINTKKVGVIISPTFLFAVILLNDQMQMMNSNS